MPHLSDVQNSNPAPQVQVLEATLLVSEAVDSEAKRLDLLDATLKRLGVQAPRLQTVALGDEPLRAARYRLRYAPCIVLDTGKRFVLLYGQPAALTPSHLEAALSRR